MLPDWKTEHPWEYEALELRDLVRHYCLQRGEFTLSSGQKSDYYLNCRKLLEAGCVRVAARLTLLRARRERLIFTAWASAETLASALLGAVLCESALKGWVQIRGGLVRSRAKTHGADPGSRQDTGCGNLRPDDRVLFLDDVASTGQTILDALAELTTMGCKVAGVIVLVDRQEGAREALHEVYGDQVPFFPLLTKADILGSSRAPGTDAGAEGQPSEVW